LRIPVETLDPSLPVQSVSTSRMKLMVPLRELDVLHSLTPDFEYLWSVCDKYQTTGFYPFVVTGKGTAEARQFPNRTGQKEDPATGIAACALGAYLVAYGKCGAKSEGWHLVRVGQGKAMGRPSLIEIGVCVENKEIVKTKIMGQAIILP
jgi:PhzF family phenazine biosynthesis protein